MSIVLRDVHRAFGQNQVLRGLDLEVLDGETTSVIGFSGAGKSVVLKHMVGLIEPDSGDVVVDGQNLSELDVGELNALRRDIGYVFQFAALFDSMSIADNVAMGLRRIPGMYDEEIVSRVHECLALVELEGIEDRYPSELSRSTTVDARIHDRPRLQPMPERRQMLIDLLDGRTARSDPPAVARESAPPSSPGDLPARPPLLRMSSSAKVI